MSLFDAEPEAAPEAPGAGQLAQVLARLFDASRESGRATSHTLSQGLRLSVSAEGEFVALSRRAGPPSELEADTVAREAGWPSYDLTPEEHGGVRYLVLRPAALRPAPIDGALPEDAEFPDSAIREALLDRAAPWRYRTTPFMHDQRDDAVRSKDRAELHEELRWLRRKFASELVAWKRARLAAALG